MKWFHRDLSTILAFSVVCITSVRAAATQCTPQNGQTSRRLKISCNFNLLRSELAPGNPQIQYLPLTSFNDCRDTCNRDNTCQGFAQSLPTDDCFLIMDDVRNYVRIADDNFGYGAVSGTSAIDPVQLCISSKASSPSNSRFNIMCGYDLQRDGRAPGQANLEYRKGFTLDQCRDRCQANPLCVGFTHHRTIQGCFNIFDDITNYNAVADPAWDAGSPKPPALLYLPVPPQAAAAGPPPAISAVPSMLTSLASGTTLTSVASLNPSSNPSSSTSSSVSLAVLPSSSPVSSDIYASSSASILCLFTGCPVESGETCRLAQQSRSLYRILCPSSNQLPNVVKGQSGTSMPTFAQCVQSCDLVTACQSVVHHTNTRVCAAFTCTVNPPTGFSGAAKLVDTDGRAVVPIACPDNSLPQILTISAPDTVGFPSRDGPGTPDTTNVANPPDATGNTINFSLVLTKNVTMNGIINEQGRTAGAGLVSIGKSSENIFAAAKRSLRGATLSEQFISYIENSGSIPQASIKPVSSDDTMVDTDSTSLDGNQVKDSLSKDNSYRGNLAESNNRSLENSQSQGSSSQPVVKYTGPYTNSMTVLKADVALVLFVGFISCLASLP